MRKGQRGLFNVCTMWELGDDPIRPIADNGLNYSLVAQCECDDGGKMAINQRALIAQIGADRVTKMVRERLRKRGQDIKTAPWDVVNDATTEVLMELAERQK